MMMMIIMLKVFEKQEGGGGSYHFTNKQLSLGGKPTLPAFYDDQNHHDNHDDVNYVGLASKAIF